MDIAFAIVRSTLLLTFAALWLAPALWVAADAQHRLRSARHIRLAIGAALAFPLAGVFLYVLLRPSESLLDRRERRALRRLIEAELEAAKRCLSCRTALADDFRCCPGCGVEVATACSECGGRLSFGWRVCPWCVAPAEPPSRLRVAA